MAQCIVHIGLHKTATTWLQRHLFPLVTSHRVVPRDVIQDALIRQHAFTFDPERARRGLQLRPGESVLLSEEHLSGDVFSGGFRGSLGRELARRIRATLPEAEIVVFFRRQPDIIASTYSQYVGIGGSHGLSRFLFHPGLEWYVPAFDFDHFDYRKWIECYAAEFGRERLHLFLYEDFAADNRAFVASFTERLGLTFGGTPSYGARERPRLGAVEQGILRFSNRFRRDAVPYKQYFFPLPYARAIGGKLSRYSRKIFPRAPGRMPASVRAYIEARYAESNAWVMRTTGLDLARLGYPCAPVRG